MASDVQVPVFARIESRGELGHARLQRSATYVDRFTPFAACASDQKSVRLRDGGVVGGLIVSTIKLSGKFSERHDVRLVCHG